MTKHSDITVPPEFQEVASICAATDVVIGGHTVIGVEDARALHAGLSVGRRYTTWIEGRITKYGFREGVDYEVSPGSGKNPEGGRPESVYRLTLGMAKELAMVENNDQGRLIRRYYIWAEERAMTADAELTRRMDGMVKMVAHKVTGIERMASLMAEAMTRQDGRTEQLETAVIELAQRVNHLMLSADPRVAALEYVSVRELLDEAGALQKGRNSLNRKIGRALRDRALLRQPPLAVLKCPHSGVWLFPRDFAAAFMAEKGNTLVADHNDRAVGQGVIKFPRRKSARHQGGEARS